MFSVFSCFQLDLYQSSGYLGKRETERENKGCGIRERGHLMCSLRSLGPLSIPLCQKPWTCKKNRTQNTHWGEGIPGMTRRQTHSAFGGIKKGKKMHFLCRGKINNLLELFHTLPLSLGIAEPCKDAPAVPQHPPPVALPTPHHAGHTLPVAMSPARL